MSLVEDIFVSLELSTRTDIISINSKGKLEDARKFAAYWQLQNESNRHSKHPYYVFVFTF